MSCTCLYLNVIAIVVFLVVTRFKVCLAIALFLCFFEFLGCIPSSQTGTHHHHHHHHHHEGEMETEGQYPPTQEEENVEEGGGGDFGGDDGGDDGGE